jgi:UDP-galactopyranose mutase
VPFTRIVEYKHFLNQKSPHTTIVKEISKDSGEPFYPVPDKKNLSLYEKYMELAKLLKNVHFIGRLASYKYFNMDQAIKNSIEFYDNFITTNRSTQTF